MNIIYIFYGIYIFLIAVVKVLNNRQLNTDSGKVSVLVLLNSSAAFDKVNSRIKYC